MWFHGFALFRCNTSPVSILPGVKYIEFHGYRLCNLPFTLLIFDSLLYVFRLMTCEAYYETHPEPVSSHDRCSNREIEAGTARAVSLLGTSTTFFGVINLFITGWNIKRFGVKTALAIQVSLFLTMSPHSNEPRSLFLEHVVQRGKV